MMGIADTRLIVSDGASCAFDFTSPFAAAATIYFVVSCVAELLIWFLASIKIYRFGKYIY